MIPVDVEEFIARRFEAPDRAAALALVKAATIHDGSVAGPRLIRCALVASGGSIEKLRGHIEHLKIDYRDVILAGEYRWSGDSVIRVRNLNKPIEDEA